MRLWDRKIRGGHGEDVKTGSGSKLWLGTKHWVVSQPQMPTADVCLPKL